MVSNEPWRSDQWFSSPWNFLPEITAEFSLPETVRVHDVTLRDGEQQAGVEFRTEDKVRIAEALAGAGVHRIEAGLPAVSPADEAAVREIVRLQLPAEIVAFSRCMLPDVQLAVDTGVRGVVMEIPSSHHLIEKAYRWPIEKAIDLSIEAGMVELLDDLDKVATHGHVDSIGLVDTFGVISPHAIRFFARSVRKRLDVPLETHFHMDFGMGVANTVLAVSEGAEVIQTTVAGIGERAGNAPMEETVMALLTMYGVDTGIDTSQFYELSHLVLGLAGVAQPSNRPVIGDRLFHVESGIIATWVNNVGREHLTEAFPYRPELVGQAPPEIVLGKGSGLDSVAIWLDRLGIGWNETKELEEVLAEVKAASLAKKGLLDQDEFRDIASRVIPAGS